MLKNISNLGEQLSRIAQRKIIGGIDTTPQVPFGGCFETQGDCHIAIMSTSLCCRPAPCGKNGDEGWEIHACLA